jgi:hypothetical protein
MPEPPEPPGLDLIMRLLEELEQLVRDGFARLDARIDRVEERVDWLERRLD